MANSIHATGRATWQSGAGSSPMSRIASRAWATARSMLRTLQTSRLMSVLAGMSDVQLAEIGITRGDIPRYATWLMSNGHDGTAPESTGGP